MSGIFLPLCTAAEVCVIHFNLRVYSNLRIDPHFCKSVRILLPQTQCFLTMHLLLRLLLTDVWSLDKIFTQDSWSPVPISNHFNLVTVCKQRSVNKFILNKGEIKLLILTHKFLAAAEINAHRYNLVCQWHTKSTSTSLVLLVACPWTVEITQHFPDSVKYSHLHCHSPDINITIKCSASLVLYVLYRLKKKSQSVDIANQGFSPTLVPASPLNKAAPPVAKTTAVFAVQENNTTNSQRRSPRCSELKRGYTIGKGESAGILMCPAVFACFSSKW